MDLINKTRAIKLRSHLDKFLVADDDRTTVRQSRNCITRRSIWLVEPSQAGAGFVRLKNCATGLFLSASEAPFLFGMTGKRVVQSAPAPSINSDEKVDFVLDWEPIRDGFLIKLRAARGGDGRFLRGNGGTPPWRNSVTHDTAAGGGAGSWALWDVEAVEIPPGSEEEWAGSELISPMTSFALSELSDDEFVSGSFPASPVACRWSPRLSMNKFAMDFFANAKSVRLRSHHDKYLTADDDEESVIQDRNASSRNARWSVEFVSGGNNNNNSDRPTLVRLKSRYGKYLTASDQPFLLGMAGRKVVQSLPNRLDSSIEWEPIRQGKRLKLRTRYGNFLRANGGLPPWRNSVTHDVPYRNSTQEWVLWDIDVVDILERREQSFDKTPTATMPPPSKPAPVHPHQVANSDSFGSDASFYSPTETSNNFSRQESIESMGYVPPKSDGRVIYYHIAEEDGTCNEDLGQGYPLQFKGKSVEELTQKLRDDTGMQDIIVCTRSPLNGKLYPLRLQLPPNAISMHVVVVPTDPNRAF